MYGVHWPLSQQVFCPTLSRLSPFSSSLSFLPATISCKNAVPYLSFPSARAEQRSNGELEKGAEARKKKKRGERRHESIISFPELCCHRCRRRGCGCCCVVRRRLRREGGREGRGLSRKMEKTALSLFSLSLSSSESALLILLPSIDAVWFLVLFGSGFAIIRPPPGRRAHTAEMTTVSIMKLDSARTMRPSLSHIAITTQLHADYFLWLTLWDKGVVVTIWRTKRKKDWKIERM